MKKKKLKYRINKVIRITLFTSLFIFTFITLGFTILSYKLDYSIPTI